MWTKIFDYSSGGRQKTEYLVHFIEAPEKAARLIMQDLHENIDLDHESCSTCGSDFDIEELTDKDFEESLNWYKHNITQGRDKIFILYKSEMTEPQLGLVKYFEDKIKK